MKKRNIITIILILCLSIASANALTWVSADQINATAFYQNGNTVLDVSGIDGSNITSGTINSARLGGSPTFTDITASGTVNIKGGDETQLQIYNALGTATRIVAGIDSSNSGIIYGKNGSGVEKWRIEADGDSYFNGGNLGIGTTSPEAKLEVSEDADLTSSIGSAQLIVSGATSGTKQLALGYDTTNDRGVIQPLRDGVGFKDLLLNPFGGNVGIGTSSPSSKLDVVGNTEINGITTINQDSDFKGLLIDSEATTTGNYALEVDVQGGARTTNFIQRSSNMNVLINKVDSGAGEALYIINAGTGNGQFIDQSGDGVALEIDSEATTAGSWGLKVVTGQGANAGYFESQGNNKAYLARTNNDGVGSNWFYRNYDSISTNSPVMFVEQDNADDDQRALEVQQDGNATGVWINMYSDNNGINVNLPAGATKVAYSFSTGSEGGCSSGQYGFYTSSGDLYWCKDGTGTKLN